MLAISASEEAEVRVSEVQGHPQVHSEFQASLSFITPCLTINNNNNNFKMKRNSFKNNSLVFYHLFKIHVNFIPMKHVFFYIFT